MWWVVNTVIYLSWRHENRRLLQKFGCCQRNISLHSVQVYVDTVGDVSAYQKKLEESFPSVKITVAKKADSLYPIVSAASICAKVSVLSLICQWVSCLCSFLSNIESFSLRWWSAALLCWISVWDSLDLTIICRMQIAVSLCTSVLFKFWNIFQFLFQFQFRIYFFKVSFSFQLSKITVYTRV